MKLDVHVCIQFYCEHINCMITQLSIYFHKSTSSQINKEVLYCIELYTQVKLKKIQFILVSHCWYV